MRLGVRLSPRLGLSMGPAGWLIALPFLLAFWALAAVVYLLCGVVYGIGWLVRQAVRAIAARRPEAAPR